MSVSYQIGNAAHGNMGTYVVVARNLLLETLALTHLSNDLARLRGGVKRRSTRKDRPVVEDGLREGLTTGSGTEIARETEGLGDGQISLDVEQRGTGSLLLGVDVTTTAGEDTVDATHGLLGNLDLDVEDGLEKARIGKESGRVQDTTSSGDDLTTTTVDGISVKRDIQNVEANSTHGLFGNRTLTGSPLETGDEGILDFVQVLDGLGLVDKQVGTRGVGTEAPDLTSIGDIPAVLISEDTGTSLEIVTRADLAVLDSKADLLVNRLCGDVQTVVLVGRLRQGSHAGLTADSLTVGDDRVGDTERNTSMVLLEILQTNLKVKFTSTSNDVLTRLVDVGQDARVRLGQTLKTLDQLGKVGSILDLDGTLHDGRNGELHNLQVVGSLIGGDSTRLEKELVDTDQTDNVTSRDIIDGLDETTHHKDGTLDSLDEQVLLLAGNVVGTLDADLETGPDDTREDTTESIETTLIRGGNHLGDVEHERTLGVTVADTREGSIVLRTLVQGLCTVSLGSHRRGEVDTDHLQKSVSSRQEFLHNGLEQSLALELLLAAGKGDLKLFKDGSNLFLLVVGNGIEDPEDGIQDEHVERTLESLAIMLSVLGPLLGLGVEVVIALYRS